MQNSSDPLRPGGVRLCLKQASIAATTPPLLRPTLEPQRAPVNTVRAIKPATTATLLGRHEECSSRVSTPTPHHSRIRYNLGTIFVPPSQFWDKPPSFAPQLGTMCTTSQFWDNPTEIAPKLGDTCTTSQFWDDCNRL